MMDFNSNPKSLRIGANDKNHHIVSKESSSDGKSDDEEDVKENVDWKSIKARSKESKWSHKLRSPMKINQGPSTVVKNPFAMLKFLKITIRSRNGTPSIEDSDSSNKIRPNEENQKTERMFNQGADGNFMYYSDNDEPDNFDKRPLQIGRTSPGGSSICIKTEPMTPCTPNTMTPELCRNVKEEPVDFNEDPSLIEAGFVIASSSPITNPAEDEAANGNLEIFKNLHSPRNKNDYAQRKSRTNSLTSLGEGVQVKAEPVSEIDRQSVDLFDDQESRNCSEDCEINVKNEKNTDESGNDDPTEDRHFLDASYRVIPDNNDLSEELGVVASERKDRADGGSTNSTKPSYKSSLGSRANQVIQVRLEKLDPAKVVKSGMKSPSLTRSDRRRVQKTSVTNRTSEMSDDNDRTETKSVTPKKVPDHRKNLPIRPPSFVSKSSSVQTRFDLIDSDDDEIYKNKTMTCLRRPILNEVIEDDPDTSSDSSVQSTKSHKRIKSQNKSGTHATRKKKLYSADTSDDEEATLERRVLPPKSSIPRNKPGFSKPVFIPDSDTSDENDFQQLSGKNRPKTPESSPSKNQNVNRLRATEDEVDSDEPKHKSPETVTLNGEGRQTSTKSSSIQIERGNRVDTSDDNDDAKREKESNEADRQASKKSSPVKIKGENRLKTSAMENSDSTDSPEDKTLSQPSTSGVTRKQNNFRLYTTAEHNDDSDEMVLNSESDEETQFPESRHRKQVKLEEKVLNSDRATVVELLPNLLSEPHRKNRRIVQNQQSKEMKIEEPTPSTSRGFSVARKRKTSESEDEDDPMPSKKKSRQNDSPELKIERVVVKNEKLPSKRPLTFQPLGPERVKRLPLRPYHQHDPYGPLEDYRIVLAVFKHDSMYQPSGDRFWEEVREEDNVLARRTIKSLRNRWSKKLKHNWQQIITNPRHIEEIEGERAERLKSRVNYEDERRLFTELEDFRIVLASIQHPSELKRTGDGLWTRVRQEDRELRRRSARSLRNRYSYYLIGDKWRKHIKNPEYIREIEEAIRNKNNPTEAEEMDSEDDD